MILLKLGIKMQNIKYLIFPISLLILGTIKILYVDFPTLIDYFFVDDSFYYLNTAWNLKLYDFVTFDGINKTNGLHLLWFWTLALFQLFFNDKIHFVYGILFLCLFINLIQFYIFYTFSKLLNIRYFYYFVAISWFHLSLSTTYLAGLDNNLDFLFISLNILYLYKILYEIDIIKIQKYNKILIVIITILPFCRIEYGIYSTAFFFILCYILKGKKLGKSIFRNTIIQNIFIALIACILMLFTFYQMGDIILPVSGLIKYHTYSKSYNLFEIISIFINFSGEALYESNIIFVILKRLFDITMKNQFIFFLLSIFSVYIFANKIKDPDLIYIISKSRFLFKIIFPVLLLHQLYGSSYGTSIHYAFWWQSGWYLLIIYTLSLLLLSSLLFIINKLKLTKYKNTIIISFLTPFFCLQLLHELTHYYSFSYILSPPYKWIREECNKELTVASWIKDNLNNETVIGAFNAGILGYFTPNPIINLDGLINGKEYYELLQKGCDKHFSPCLTCENLTHVNQYRNNIIPYLKKYNCKYIIDFGLYKKPEIILNTELIEEINFSECENLGAKGIYSIRKLIY